MIKVEVCIVGLPFCSLCKAQPCSGMESPPVCSRHRGVRCVRGYLLVDSVPAVPYGLGISGAELVGVNSSLCARRTVPSPGGIRSSTFGFLPCCRRHWAVRLELGTAEGLSTCIPFAFVPLFIYYLFYWFKSIFFAFYCFISFPRADRALSGPFQGSCRA